MENYDGVTSVIEIRADIGEPFARVLNKFGRIISETSEIGEEILKKAQEFYNTVDITFIGQIKIFTKEDGTYKVHFLRADNEWKPIYMITETDDIVEFVINELKDRSIHRGEFYQTKKLKLQNNVDPNATEC